MSDELSRPWPELDGVATPHRKATRRTMLFAARPAITTLFTISTPPVLGPVADGRVVCPDAAAVPARRGAAPGSAAEPRRATREPSTNRHRLSQPPLRCRTKLLAAVSNTGKSVARSAGSPRRPAELSRKRVHFREVREWIDLMRRTEANSIRVHVAGGGGDEHAGGCPDSRHGTIASPDTGR